MNRNLALATLVIGSTLCLASSVEAVGIQKLADLSSTNGRFPLAGLTQGTNGLFYGTTYSGGPIIDGFGLGTIFSFNPAGNVLTTVANFGELFTSGPFSSLTLGTNGLFYGITINDAGTIFSFDPNNNALTSVVVFDRSSAFNPTAGLTLGTNGLFYGTTIDGGTNHQGITFSFNPTGNVLTTLASFDDFNMGSPVESLTLGNNGLFYGITERGVFFTSGTIFSFNPTNNVLTSGVASFNGLVNGSNPLASLTLGTNGLLYGTTTTGGTNNLGTIFSFNPSDNLITRLASFNGTNGSDPNASLTLGSDGLFYSTTTTGGPSNQGTIFSFNPNGNVLTNLASFNGTNGSFPIASLTQGTNGIFYGITPGGGTSGNGTIFSFDAAAVPEPLSLLGAITALGLGGALKRRLK